MPIAGVTRDILMKKAALIILDGWGYRPEREANAVAQAGTPNIDRLLAACPWTTLGASGMAVGLPEGQMGNSEVGHLNLGAGRVVYQDFTRINLAIETGEFYENAEIVGAIEAARKAGGKVHLMGLVSDGGVHSHMEHLYALVETAKRRDFKDVAIHAFLDGRDTPPKSGLGYIRDLEAKLAEKCVGRIATVGGRFWGMDRDTRWERVEKAYKALRRSEGECAASASAAVEAAYARGETDEFVIPTVIAAPGEEAVRLSDGDSVIFFNFRSDRARQMTRALTQAGFKGFDISDRPALSSYVTFTEYDETFGLPIAFPSPDMKNILAEVLSHAGLTQLRIAETEKYAHVTFFFNGGVEKSWPGEERALIASPRDIATYDQRPEMSAYAVKDRLVAEIESGRHDCIICNFANLDMVGHTGIMEAAMSAVRAVDACLGEIVAALEKAGYSLLLTADHGNAELMWDDRANQPMTAHTTNPVPLVLMDASGQGRKLDAGGILADVAPTILALLGVEKPAEMTGRSLLKA